MRRSCLLFVVLSAPLFAADWPAWRGADRTGKSKETGLLKEWPEGGPKLLWTSEETGVGYSGPAVVGDRLYVMGVVEGKEKLLAVDVKTGKRAWAADVGAPYDNKWGGGPRSTPTVDGDFVYALGAGGDLACFEAKTGKRVWAKSLVEDLGGAVPFWGYSESPLIDGDRLIVTPGGKKGTLAALDKKDGAVLWRSEKWADAADYASVVVGEARGKRQYVQMADKSVAGVDAKSGELLWRFERKHRITIPTPITSGDYVYVASAYGVGSTLLEIGDAGAKEVYSTKVMTNHHGGVVLLDGKVYGHCDVKGWTCQDLKSGEAVWSSKKAGKGSITYADGRFYLFTEKEGACVLIDASAEKYTERGRFTLPKTSQVPRPPSRPSANFWTHPVVANGKLYLRDQEYLFCFEVKE